MRSHRLTRFILVGLISCGLLLGAGLTALANHGKDGDPISEIPDLFADGTTFGTLKDHDDSTEPNGKYREDGGICDSAPAYNQGASAYKFSATIRTAVTIELTDDIAGASLCEVHLYRQNLGEDALLALYDFPDLDDYLVGRSGCPASASTCRIKWVIPEDDTYYLVFWPCGGEWGGDCEAPDDEANFATFNFKISVREPTKTKLAIGGATKPSDSNCYIVKKNASVTAISRVTNEAAGNVEFRVERKKAESWILVGTNEATLTESKAAIEQSFERAGAYRMRAEYLGDDSHAPSRSKRVCFKVS